MENKKSGKSSLIDDAPRKERLKAALKANMAKRKAQARARAASSKNSLKKE